MPLRVGIRAHQVQLAQSDLWLKIFQHQNEHDLTDIELLQALSEMQTAILKLMLRRERNPDNPDKGADEE